MTECPGLSWTRCISVQPTPDLPSGGAGPQGVLTLGTVYVLTLMCPLIISAPLSFPAVSSPRCEFSPCTQFCANGSQKSIYNPRPSPKFQILTSIYLRRPAGIQCLTRQHSLHHLLPSTCHANQEWEPPLFLLLISPPGSLDH